MSNISSATRKEIQPPVDQLPGFEIIKQKLNQMAEVHPQWKLVDPNRYLARNSIKEQLFGEDFYEKYDHKITIKIYLSNVQENQTWARVGHTLTGNFPFGSSHAGLQVENKTVNWYDNSLVTIGELKSSSGFILFSPNENLQVTLTKDLLDKMTNFIMKWNIAVTYNTLNYNCHVFVEEFLKVVGLPMPSGTLGKFIDGIRRGNTERKISTKNCGVLEFKDHDELDDLEYKHSAALSAEEKKILKLFHRGFQLQEMAINITRIGCPQGDIPTGKQPMLPKAEVETL